MILGWKTCCQVVSTTQIQIQCKPSQNPKDVSLTLKKKIILKFLSNLKGP